MTDQEEIVLTDIAQIQLLHPIAFAAGQKAQAEKDQQAIAEAKKEGMRELAEKIKQALEEKNRIAAVENVLELEGKWKNRE